MFVSFESSQSKCCCVCWSHFCTSGSRLHCAGGCGCGQEAGADQGWEACPQLHDGHTTLQTSEWTDISPFNSEMWKLNFVWRGSLKALKTFWVLMISPEKFVNCVFVFVFYRCANVQPFSILCLSWTSFHSPLTCNPQILPLYLWLAILWIAPIFLAQTFYWFMWFWLLNISIQIFLGFRLLVPGQSALWFCELLCSQFLCLSHLSHTYCYHSNWQLAN